jgi:hypothetical protein
MIRDHALLALSPDPSFLLRSTLVGQADREDATFEVVNHVTGGVSSSVEIEAGVNLEALGEGVGWVRKVREDGF